MFPRVFFRFQKKIDLHFRLINQEQYIDRKTGAINASSHLAYVMDIRVDIKNLSKNFSKNLTLVAEATTKFHHNYGSPNDVTNEIANLRENFEINTNATHKEVTFLWHFPCIGVKNL